MDWRVRRVLAAGFLAVFGLLALHGVNRVFLGDGPWLALDNEKSVSTWYSVTNFFAAGMAGLLLAIADPRRRRWWLLAGLMFAGLGFDDAIGVHEATEDAANDASRLLLQPLVAGVGCAVLVLLGRRLGRVPRLCLYASAAFFAGGIACSLVTAYSAVPHALYVGLMYLEETSEMLLATCMIAAALATRLAQSGTERVPTMERPTLVHSVQPQPAAVLPPVRRRRAG